MWSRCFIRKNYNIIINKSNIIHSLIFAIFISLLYNPTKNLDIKKFSRQIGIGVLANYDVLVLIRQFYIWIICFTVLFLLFSVIFGYFRIKVTSVYQKAVLKFWDNFSVIVFCCLCLTAVPYFQNNSIINGSGKNLLVFCLFVYTACGAYIFFSLDRIFSPLFFHKLIISIFSFSCFAIYSVPAKFYFKFNFYIILFGLLIFTISVLFFTRKLSNHNWFKLFFDFIFSGIAILPMFVSLIIEGIYVLNQHSIFITHIKYFFVGIFTVLCICSFTYSFICIRMNRMYNLWNKQWIYPILVFGIILCSNQPPLQGMFSPDIYESANYSILISDFLNFGKLPTIEHYGGHQLLYVLSSIFYGLVNNDLFGAIMKPYSNWIIPSVCGVLLYVFLSEIIGKTNAFFFCLLIPYEFFYVTYFAIVYLSYIFAIKYIQKPSLTKAFCIWFAFAWTTLSRLDLGFSTLVGIFFVFTVYYLKTKNKSVLKQLLFSFAVVVVAGIFIWIFLCLIKGINPISRLYEFLTISTSNPMWAYNHLGDNSKIAYLWIYCIIPFCIAGMCVYSLIYIKINKSQSSVFYSFIFSVFAYFANIPRFLVRHSFVEGVSVLSQTVTAWLVFPIFVVLITKKRKYFVPVIVILLFVRVLIFYGNNTFYFQNYLDRFVSVEKNIKIPPKEKINRVLITEQSQEHYKPLIPVLNSLLMDDESFIDFTDSTFIYSVLGRKCPVYVSQSPSMLSGEYSQEQFIKQIESQKDKLPLVLFSTSSYYLSQYIDGVPITLRHYKVAEYLYQNYRPFCSVGEYAIWCEKEKWKSYQSRFENAKKISSTKDISKLSVHNCTINKVDKADAFFSIISQESDAYVENFESLFPFFIEFGKTYHLCIDFKTTEKGIVQLFFAKDKNLYSEQNSISRFVDFSGCVDFLIKLDEDTKLRLDIPDKSNFIINRVYLIPENEFFGSKITYGYDDFLGFHEYNLNYLAYLWANKDLKNAKQNTKLADLINTNDLYYLPKLTTNESIKGNYILLQDLQSDNEDVVLIEFGTTENNSFIPKYRMPFVTKTGKNDYLLRASVDYYWYTGDINSIRIASQSSASINCSVSLLDGD